MENLPETRRGGALLGKEGRAVVSVFAHHGAVTLEAAAAASACLRRLLEGRVRTGGRTSGVDFRLYRVREGKRRKRSRGRRIPACLLPALFGLSELKKPYNLVAAVLDVECPPGRAMDPMLVPRLDVLAGRLVMQRGRRRGEGRSPRLLGG